jgi:hypothetical protein
MHGLGVLGLMHWDGSISVGNILTFLGMVAFILGAANRFMGQQKEQHQAVTTAVNNLSAITSRLDSAVQTQNGRLAKVETELAIRKEVERRLAALAAIDRHSTQS